MKLFLLLFILIPIFAFSQPKGYSPGYVITVKGDTVRGFLGVTQMSVFGTPNTPFWFEFRDSNNVKRKFSHDDVMGFYILGDSVSYHLVTFLEDTSETDTMKLMAKAYTDTSSYLSYYEVQLGRGLDYFYHVLQKKDDADEVFYSDDAFQGFKKRVTKYLKDDPALCAKIENGIYKRGDIVKIVREYNAFHAASLHNP